MMNLSFSTRGWHDTPWEVLVEEAHENGFSGIELYNPLKYEAFTGKDGPFHRYKIASTVRDLARRGIRIPCLDSPIDLSGDREDAVKALKALTDLAADAKVPYVCCFSLNDAEEQVKSILEEMIPYAEKKKITILLKTSGVYANTERLRNLLDHFACDQLAVIYDVYHPYRDFDETPAVTIGNLGAYVRHVHLRDSGDNGQYELIGEGNMPIGDIMKALGSIDYNGCISMEWKPEYLDDLQDPAIILPHFEAYMENFDNPRGKKKVLYFNHDGSGQFVWKKDELISMTFGQVLDRMVEEFPNQYAFRYTTLDYIRTYEQFRDDVDTFAKALIAMGVRAGSKVAVWATNVPAWYISFWASAKIGAVLVTMNTAYKIHEAEYLLRQSDTHTLVMIESALDSDYRAIINELCPEIRTTKAGSPLHCRKLPFLRNIITVGFREAGCLTFEEAMQKSTETTDEELRRMASAVRPDDVCNMQYTSGTTGFPKGVMLTHYNVVNNGKCIGDRMDLSTADRMMIQVPMFHCFGMVLSMTSCMTHGATLCPLPYFSAKSSLACINQEHITCFNGVPTMFIAMFNHPDYRKTDFSYMRTGIMAGSGCPPELMRRAARDDEMHMTGIVSVYGQTESSPGSTMSAWDDPLDVRCDTVGYNFPHVQCKVIDPETGEEVGAGVNGEFCSRGYNTMKGYYKMPVATAETVDEDGWLHSGDIACRDENGNYRITGRLKDMIIRGGENIYPKEIEEFIYTINGVQDVQVVSVPDKRYGEEACACIIPKKGVSLDADAVREYCMSHMARHKVPRYIDIVESFPLNAAGKVLKYKMREEARERHGL